MHFEYVKESNKFGCQEQLSGRDNKLVKPPEGDQSNKIYKGYVSIEFQD